MGSFPIGGGVGGARNLGEEGGEDGDGEGGVGAGGVGGVGRAAVLQPHQLGERGCLPHYYYDEGRRQVAFLLARLTDPLNKRREGGRSSHHWG